MGVTMANAPSLKREAGFASDASSAVRGRPEARRVTIYRPDNRLGDGPFTALRHFFGELIRFRAHIVTIFRRDFQASYRGTTFGIFWNFAFPLIPISIYIMLATFRVLPNFEGVPSSVAISVNATIWFLLVGCVQQPISMVRGRNAEAMKTALPLLVSIASSFGRVLFDTLVRLAFVAVVIVATGIWPEPMAPLTVLLLALALLFCFGLGLFLAVVNIIAPDVERVVAVGFQYGFFVSGVIFPLAKLGPLAILETINPFAVFITAARDLIFHGTITNVVPLAAWVVAGVLFFVYGARVFYLMEHRIRGVL